MVVGHRRAIHSLATQALSGPLRKAVDNVGNGIRSQGSSVGCGEAHQGDVIRKILKHCGPWKDPPPRGPPRKTRPSQAVRPTHEADGGITYEVDPDFLEHTRRETYKQPERRWDV